MPATKEAIKPDGGAGGADQPHSSRPNIYELGWICLSMSAT